MKVKALYFWIVFAIALLSVLGGGYLHLSKQKTISMIMKDLSNTKSDVATLEEINNALVEELELEKQKNSLFSGQINEIYGTVGSLSKLAKTDKELLQKYSKVYFLNEHYIPDSLVKIAEDYLYEPKRELEFHSKAYYFLEAMMKDAIGEGVDLKIASAYRSFGEQGILKNGYTFSYGNGANKFSADQGYSEHQLGTAIDFTTSKTGSNFNAFDETEAYQWLLNNAYKYGFVLSYPEGNSYYQFEPWHWRFVGKALALRLDEEGENFYDLSQNKIDAYLINIFD